MNLGNLTAQQSTNPLDAILAASSTPTPQQNSAPLGVTNGVVGTLGANAPVYWVGQDGNIYYGSGTGNGVQNAGAPQNAYNTGFDTKLFSAQATPIADPNPGNPQPTLPTNSTSLQVGGGGSGQTFQDTTGARNATLASLNQLDTILGNKNTEAKGNYDGILKQYTNEEANNLADYTKNVQTNESNRGAQTQAALLAAANGGRGLNSVLASIGALGGTGRLLANRAVANESNLDIGNANKTFDTNAGNLFDSYGKLKKEEEQRRNDAGTTYKDTIKGN